MISIKMKWKILNNAVSVGTKGYESVELQTLSTKLRPNQESQAAIFQQCSLMSALAGAHQPL